MRKIDADLLAAIKELFVEFEERIKRDIERELMIDIRSEIAQSEVRLRVEFTNELRTEIKKLNDQQTAKILDAIAGIADMSYQVHPTREEVKKGLVCFGEAITLQSM